MPNQLTLQVGATISTVPIKGTNAAINAAILRYAVHRGIDTNGKTPTEIGAAVLGDILRYVKDNSIDRERIDLLAAQQAAIEAQIALDNDL